MEPKRSIAMPMAIVIAGIVIAGSIIYSVGKSNTPSVEAEPDLTANLDKMRPVAADDHIRGDIKAPVVIVEYSDSECPFCKRFHDTMKEVVKKYDGKIAWVYRHFPLKELHPKAVSEAQAMECASKLGGHEMFWQYADAIYAATPTNDADPEELPKIAAKLGLNKQAFASCLANNDTLARVEADLTDAMATGGNGTPWSIMIGPDGTKYAINGAQPIESISQMIDLALKTKE